MRGPTSHPSRSRGSEGASRRLALTGSEWRETLRAVVGSGSVRHKRPQSSAASSKHWWGERVTASGFPRAPQATPPSGAGGAAAPTSSSLAHSGQRVSALQQHVARLRPSERRGPRSAGAQSRPRPHLRPPPPQACTSLSSLPVPLQRPCDSEAWGAAASLWPRPPWRCCLGVGGTQLPAYEEGPRVPGRA